MEQEQRIESLWRRSDAAGAQGRTAEAVVLLREALALCRDLAGGRPEHALRIAGGEYTLGALLIRSGDHAGAVLALDRSERAYLSTGRDVAGVLADVRMRRATARIGSGAGATAVDEADRAVTACRLLPHHPGKQAHLARLLAGAARVQYRVGDPELALNCAEPALDFFTAGGRVFPDEIGSAVTACVVAASVHAALDRPAESLDATRTAYLVLGAAAPREAFSAPDEALDALHHAAGLVEELAASRVYGEAGAHAAALREAFLPGTGEPSRFSLSEALGPYDSGLAGWAATTGRAACVPSDRCDASAAAAWGRRLAEVALRAGDPERRARIGLDAHWLFAAAARTRAGTGGGGELWARLLLALTDVFGGDGDLAMALDLASWAAGLTRTLVPYMAVDRDLAALGSRCVERHGHLLTAVGNRGEGEAALRFSRQLADLSG